MTYNFLFGTLVFSIVVWGVVGTVAAIAAVGFYNRYSKGPTAGRDEG
jgi:hypothetical protein